MKIWIDAQISPFIAAWINRTFNDEDKDIFLKAREQQAVIMSKDADFVKLLEQNGPPPQFIWITCGNTSNAKICEILSKTLMRALARLKQGEPLVEISDWNIEK